MPAVKLSQEPLILTIFERSFLTPVRMKTQILIRIIFDLFASITPFLIHHFVINSIRSSTLIKDQGEHNLLPEHVVLPENHTTA